MARALGNDPAAPFSEAVAAGFLFESSAFRQIHHRLNGCLEARHFSFIVSGVAGIGKRTAVMSWAEEQAHLLNVATLAGADLTPGAVAADVLRAFGQRPAHGASAREALEDFLADCRASDRPCLVVLTDADQSSAAAWSEFWELCGTQDRGGVALSCVVTAATASIVTGRSVTVEPMNKAEMGAFLAAVLEATGGGQARLTDGLVDSIWQESAGVLERAGRALDHYWATGTQHGTAPNVLSPDDIEQALLDLRHSMDPNDRSADDVELPPIIDALPAGGPGAVTHAYPTIETDFEPGAAPAAANDCDPNDQHHVTRDLEEIIREAAALQGALVIVKEQAERLKKAAEERSERLDEAARDFVKCLRNPEGPDS